MPVVSPLSALPRAWWFPQLKGYRSSERNTYVRCELDSQPDLSHIKDLSWLEDVPEVPHESIGDGQDGQQAPQLNSDTLDAFTGTLTLPDSLRRFARRRDLQRRIRSVTACYLEPGDFAARTTPGDGSLVHVLSDQQWCMHWLVYVDPMGNESVLSTPEPIGFELPDDWEDVPPTTIPIDGTFDVQVCADSFAEFLYRFWIENELWHAVQRGEVLPPPLADYPAALPLVG